MWEGERGQMEIRDPGNGWTTSADIVPSLYPDRAEIVSRLDGDSVAALQRARDRLDAEVENLLEVAQRTH